MILHIDMDAFYAAVEQLDDPSLRGRCVIVGGTSGRGVVATASYEARRFGVHSAMPIFEARRRCPQAVFIKPRRERYQAVSRRIMAILERFTPLVEPVSIDEAYLDVTGCERIGGPPAQIARCIKALILEETGLTCSVGGAPVKFLAKIASEMQKPDGLTLIEGPEVAAVIERLPIERVPGVGPAALARLAPRGIKTLADAGRLGEAALERRLGKFGRRLAALARGEDPSPVTPHSETKSISAEVTLARDTADPGEMKKILLDQAEDVARQLRHQGLRARTVVLKLKHDDFRQLTRSRTLEAPTQSAHTLFGAAAALLDAYRLRQPVRLVGVGAANLVPANRPVQTALFPTGRGADGAWEKVERALDAIEARFGPRAVRRAGQGDVELP
ncbi:MAG: DNA polymerase IV [Desulfobacterales bacterium]|jgi:DNA polymerase-4|nr:DNA polymerase IV [Desulfobacteraceae bacterium]MDY0312633.1 DNA polymerase IV [Desulfobacterales bacterium]